MQFFTIGVYHATEKEFFDRLVQNKIDTFCDIRQLRGVRGARYAFANSNHLQDRLKKLGIQYYYEPQLASTKEMRKFQGKVDEEKGLLKSERTELATEFITEYKKAILKKFDFKEFFTALEKMNAKRIILFCVEQHPEACHRSIVAKELEEKYGYRVKHL